MASKWSKFLLVAASTFLLSSSGGDFSPREAAIDETTINEVNLHFFFSDSCSHCKEEKEYIVLLQTEHANLVVNTYLIDPNLPYSQTGNLNTPNPDYETNKNLLNDSALAFGHQLDPRDDLYPTPYTIIGGKDFEGFNENVKFLMRKYIEKYTTTDQVDIVAKIRDGIPVADEDFDTTIDYEYYLPWIGIVNIQDVSLGLSAIVLGLVDGFNPCAMWVLLFLITLLLPTGDRKRIFILGGVFLLTSALFYFALMMAWIHTVALIAAQLAFRIIIGAFAIAAGGYNLYLFIKNVREKDVGCEVTDEVKRHKLMDRVKTIVSQNKLILALLGVIALALIVNFIELACSSGLPVLFAQILAVNGLTGFSGVGFVLIYIFFFILDDLIVFTIVMLTMKIKAISNKITRYNHLIGAIIMVAIGILMIFFPNILQFSF